MSTQEKPQTVDELIERLSASTLETFLSGWLNERSGTAGGEASVDALTVWDHLDKVGILQPDWVGVAHAAAHYARQGCDL